MKTKLDYCKKLYDSFLTRLHIFIHLQFSPKKLSLQGFFGSFPAFFLVTGCSPA